jgi:hypothetical protein
MRTTMGGIPAATLSFLLAGCGGAGAMQPFGNGLVAGPTNTLFFTAGPNGEADGLSGRIDFVPAMH